MSVTSGFINEAGHLILVRDSGATIDAGDFTDIVSDLMVAEVTAQIAAADIPAQVNTSVNAALAGNVFAKGNISGAVSFAGITKDTLVNATITATLIGNITIDAANFPATPKPGTQFAFRMTQDVTGSRTLTLTGIKKSMGVLTLSTAPGAIDMIVFMYDGTNWYAGAMGLAFA